MKSILHWRPASYLLFLIGIVAVVMVVRLAVVVPASERPAVESMILGLLGFLVLLLLIGGYRLNWTWTGFGPNLIPKVENHEFLRGKTLWDWMQLLIVPAVMASVAFLFNSWNASIQRDIADDNQREAALQTYFDKMSDLLISESPADAKNSTATQVVARTRTLTLLRRLDEQRQGILLQFLRDSQVFSTTETIIDLSGANLRAVTMRHANLGNVDLHDANLNLADLTGAVLSGANLAGANLKGTNLGEADLTTAKLRGADLGDAYLGLADLSGADISISDLSNANLHSANLSDANLSNANLGGANLTDANLNLVNLSGANLLNATLRDVNLWRANLSGAILWNTDLSGANLTEANLAGADLRGANLAGAQITPQQFSNIKSLQDATMPDRTRHN